MPRAVFAWLLAAALALVPLAASAGELVLENQSSVPVTVIVISPCGQSELYLVQVAAQSSTGYDTPTCPGGAAQGGGVDLAVFDQRTSAPGTFAMMAAAKATVGLPARVIITRQTCEECDTPYKMEWVPFNKQ